MAGADFLWMRTPRHWGIRGYLQPLLFPGGPPSAMWFHNPTSLALRVPTFSLLVSLGYYELLMFAKYMGKKLISVAYICIHLIAIEI